MGTNLEESADAVIKTNDLLSDYMSRVLQRTFPKTSWEDWGLSTQSAFDAGLSAAPQTTWLHNRLNSGDCAVNSSSVTIVTALTKLVLEGRVPKFNSLDTSVKAVAFFREELDCSIPDNAFSTSGRYDKEAAASCLSACVDTLFSNLVDKPEGRKAALRKTVEDCFFSFLEAGRQHTSPISVVRNHADDYARSFTDFLHLEDAFENKASLRDVFVPPSAKGSQGHASEAEIQDSLEELVVFCEAADSHAKRQPNCIAVLSDAGSGKTSLLKALCHRLKEAEGLGRDIVCVPFSELNTDELIHQNDPVEYIRRALGKDEATFDESVVLLDGLDELYLGLPAGSSSIEFFNRLTFRCSERRRCRFVITSRADYVDKKLLDEETLYKVRIIELEKMSRESALGMVYELANIHGSLGKPAIGSIPKMFEQLKFLSIPLLLYTVAALEIDVSAARDKGEIYERVFSEMERRAYNRPTPVDWAGEDRVRSLRLFAQAAATEMRRHGANSLDERGEKIVASRLARLGMEGSEIEKAEQTFKLSLYTLYGKADFLHRSFGEFLAAEDVCRFVASGMSGALPEDEWFKIADYLFSGHVLTNEVMRFFVYKVGSGSNPAEKVAAYLTEKLIHVVIHNGVVSSIADSANEDTLDKIECVVINLWLLIKFIQPDNAVLENESLDSKGALLRYLLMAREDQRFPLVLKHENLSLLNLRRKNFHSANLRKSRFVKTNLRSANFRMADLGGADLRFSDLGHADFTGAILSGANLSYANIDGIDLHGVKASRDNPVIASADQAPILDAASVPYVASSLTTDDANTLFIRVLRMLIWDEDEVRSAGTEYSYVSLDEAGSDRTVNQKLLSYRERSRYVRSRISYYLVDTSAVTDSDSELAEFVELVNWLLGSGDHGDRPPTPA